MDQEKTSTDERFALLEFDAPTPTVQAPSVQAPSVQALSVQAPSVQAPSVQAPSVQAPSVQAPSFREPSGVNPLGMDPVELRGIMPRGQRPPGVPVPTNAPSLRSGDIVAGASASGQGALIGWQGAGELPRASILAALDRAGLLLAWAPIARSARNHAGKACQAQNYAGCVVRAEKKATHARKGAFRWIVGRATIAGEVGDHFGQISATVDLEGDVLTCVGDPGICSAIQGEYQRLASGELLQAGEVTAWLAFRMRNEFGAVSLGGVFYVPRRHVASAQKLCTELARVWGCSWILPALPIATSDELRAGLCLGLIGEVEAISAEIAARRAKQEIGERAASGFVVRLREIAARTRAYSDLLGAEHVASVRTTAESLLAELEPICNDTTLRGSLIWEEIQGETVEPVSAPKVDAPPLPSLLERIRTAPSLVDLRKLATECAEKSESAKPKLREAWADRLRFFNRS